MFRDVGGIEYGENFETAIDSHLGESGAVVVVIGKRWAVAMLALITLAGFRAQERPGR